MERIWQQLGAAALSVFYPQACAVCGINGRDFADGCACAACWTETQVFDGTESLCNKCGKLWLVPLRPEIRAKACCTECRTASYTLARAVGVYAKALRAVVLELKVKPHLPSRAADLLAMAAARSEFAGATRLMPVPLHAQRLAERGFNQAAIIGRELAQRTGLPLDEYSLVREIYTSAHRAGMDAQARHETVEKAFSVARPRLVKGERILLVDDVFTTGATATACTKVLLAAGAKDVRVLTLARVA